MQPSENSSVSSSKTIILMYGGIAGVAALLVNVVLISIDNKLIYTFWGFLSLLSVLAVGVIAALKLKVTQGGYLAFGQSVAVTMGVYVIGMVFSILFDLALMYFSAIPSDRASGITIVKLVQTFFSQILLLSVFGLFANVVLSIFIKKESLSNK
jgi:hypothetical protein